MKKIITFLFALSLVLVTTGAACQKGLTAEEQAAIRPVTLRYWTVFNDVSVLRQFANEYQQMRPHVRVSIRTVRPEEFDQLFANALADDVGPDITSMHTRWLRKYQNRLMPAPGAVRVARSEKVSQFSDEIRVTFDQFAIPSAREVETNYVTAVADDAVISNQVFGFPLAFDTMALYYNKTLLDNAGIAVPPNTWDDFVDAVRRSTVFDSEGNIIQSGVALGTGENIDYSFDILSLLMQQNGVPMLTNGRVSFGTGVERAGNSHPTVQALTFYSNFSQPTQDFYSWNEELGNSFENFVRGRSVFYFGFAYDRDRILARAPQMDLEVIEVPQLNQSSPTNVANYWVESVVKKTRYPNEAWDFVRYMTTPENVARYVEATGQPSPYRTQIAQQANDDELGPFSSQALFAQNWYKGKDVLAAEGAFYTLLQQFVAPLGERENRNRRNAQIISNAAQVVQQTF